MKFILCYTDNENNNVWESIIGEDAMMIRVDELMDELHCDAADILVFDQNTQW